MTRRRNRFVALTLAASVLTVPLLEVGLHGYLAGIPLMGESRPDAELGWTGRLRSDARNDYGTPPYRDEEFVILLQGDSQAWGYGLSDAETVAARLEKELPNARCINAGVPGYDLQQYPTQAERLRVLYPVDRRILLVNVGNDYACSALQTPYLYPRPYLEQDGQGGEIGTDTN